MSKTDLDIFRALKVQLGEKFAQTGEVSTHSIQAWKGKEIFNFQENLAEKTGGRISEKWFYTHIKNDADKLPRIDMLNILCQFLDYKDWYEFKNEKLKKPESNDELVGEPVEIKTKKTIEKTSIDKVNNQDKKSKNPLSWKLFSIVPILFIGLFYNWYASGPAAADIRFCFLDMDRKTAIIQPIEIEILKENQSSVFYKSDKDGCINLPKESEILKFVVRSPYYEADTVLRILNDTKAEESIPLRTNDFALMIHYFSISDVENWKRRREQLHQMIHEDAIIYQIYEATQIGMDMLNKDEFIDKLTLPVNSLKNIEIIDTQYADEQIISLRFRQINRKQ